MSKTKKRLALSVASLLLVLTLLGGSTLAWFMDTEQMGSNFQAGVLDVDLTEGSTEEVAELNFTNLRPLTIDQLRDEFQMDEDGVITNKNQEGYDGVPLYFYQVNVENKGTLPARINLAIREQAKGSDPNLPYGHTIPNIVDNGTGGVQVDEDEPEIACENGLRGVLHIQLYRVVETEDGYALQPIDNGAGPEDADGTVTLWKDGEPSDYAVPEILKAGEKDSYIVAAWLPETVGNESQGQHFHAALYVNAGQVDEGAGMAPLPDWGDSSEGEGGEQGGQEGGETQDKVQATVKVYYQTVDGTRALVKEVDRAIEAVPGSVDLKPLASELEGTGYRPANMDETYTITLAEDGTVTYQGEDTAASFTAEKDAYVDDTSKDFDSGDGTKENPFLIMNARQLDNVRKYLGGPTEFYYFKIGRDIDLTGYYGESWDTLGWKGEDGGIGWMPLGWKSGYSQCDEFFGNLDGQGFTITGLQVTSEKQMAGLFGWLKGSDRDSDMGVIRNLNVEDPSVWGYTQKGHTYDGKVGVIAGQTNNGATIENCTVTGGLIGGGSKEDPTKSVGGIVGFLGSRDDQVIGCTVSDLDVAVTVLESEVREDPDAYAKRLIYGYKQITDNDTPTNCTGSGRVNGTEASIVFE